MTDTDEKTRSAGPQAGGERRPVAAVATGFLALLLVYLLFWPLPFAAAPDAPVGKNPAGGGIYAKNNKLAEARPVTTGEGPESIAIDRQGRLYSGLEDGSIIRVDGEAVRVLANTGGRPIGVEFDAAGNLIIADIYEGLLSMTPDGALTVLADSFDGLPMIFVDDLAIADDGKIYFSDASMRWPYGEEIAEAFERRPSGRLFVYDPTDGSLRLLLDGLLFANGVALGPDDAFVLVNETFAHRIVRLWLTGPRAGEREIFAENLPGFLDNITEAPGGGYWLALVNPRSAALDALVGNPVLRQVAWRFMALTGANPAVHHSYAVKLDENGRPLVSWEDDSGHIFDMTSVIERGGKLYLGSLRNNVIGIIDAP